MSGRNKRILKMVKVTSLAFFGTVVVTSLLSRPLLQAIWALLLGWLKHTFRVVPLLDWNAELIFCFLLALTLGTWMLHRALNWLHQQGSLKQAWTAKRTIALTSLLLMLFGMSVAMTGIVHQSIWVMKGKITQRRPSIQSSPTTAAINQAKEIFTLCFSYARDHEGNYPDSLNQLANAFADDLEFFEPPHGLLYYQPEDSSLPLEPWVYYPHSITDRTNLILFHSSSPAFRGKWIVTNLSGSVEVVSDDEFQEMLALNQKHQRTKRAQLKANNSASKPQPSPRS